ncbi:Bacterial type II secretion system protein F domain protein [Roseivivax jejudonensis]|uniref:Bacterial type II secretion system protein F domain protein n=1 Tax=Roseivivax jejudonensis TaxID=1529041 RepID=A0A1X7A791_9RHOB|nr:type II secretion system F family protein [Roseivivax jejudonensis]SLN72392.1 Bacterial type II secretion system protein F domain protein [Roseivivax jejudonensis]
MLDQFNAMLVGMLGPAGPLIAVGGLAFVLLLACIPMMLNSRPDPLDKLVEKSNRGRMEAETRAVLREKAKNDKLNKYAQFLEPQNVEEYTDIKKKLLNAGYRSKEAVRYYYLAQFVLGLGLLGCGLVYYLVALGPDATPKQMAMYILGPGIVGYMGPKYWVNKRCEERRQQIQDGFPDALDMMLVCVEAGQSMDQAIVRISKELRASYPALAEEFQLVSYEMKAGKDKSAVLNDMSERCGVQDVSSFVTVLNQSASFGTSVADALRVYASEMRDKRVMRAEEKANKLPTKMTLTTMMLTVPPLLIILVGPSAVGVMELGSLGQ